MVCVSLTISLALLPRAEPPLSLFPPSFSLFPYHPPSLSSLSPLPLSLSPGLDTANQADRLYNHFGPGTPFEATRKQTASPKQGCWTNHNLKTFMAKREEKEADQSDTGSKDPDGLVKAIAVLAMYHGRENMMEQVEACVRVTQVSGWGHWNSLSFPPSLPSLTQWQSAMPRLVLPY